MGFERVAAALNAEGVMPRQAAAWGGWAVNKILSRTAGKWSAAGGRRLPYCEGVYAKNFRLSRPNLSPDGATFPNQLPIQKQLVK